MEIIEQLIAEIADRVQEERSGLEVIARYYIALERAVQLIGQVRATLASDPKWKDASRPGLFDVTALAPDEAEKKLLADAIECQFVEGLTHQLREETITALKPLLMYWCESCGVSKDTATTFLSAMRLEFG